MKNAYKKMNGLMVLILIILSITIKNMNAQTNSFYVYFIQNGKRVNIADAKVDLKKQAFQIYVEYTEPLDLFINASYKSNTYSQAKIGKLMFQMDAFSNVKNLESFFMNTGTINLFDDKCVIWEKGKTESEDIIKTEDSRYLAHRNIERIYSVDHENLLKIEDVKFDLFLVFIYAEKQENSELQEIQRELVKIKWVESYNEETGSYTKLQKQNKKIKLNEQENLKKRKEKLEKQDQKRLQKIEEKKKKFKEKEAKKLNKENDGKESKSE